MNRLLQIILSLITLLILAMFWTSTDNYKMSNINSELLPMTFAHADHAKEQCVTCHHNYQDNTGQGLCIICHQTNEEISYLIEEQFHDLCMGCHTEKVHKKEKSGPMRHCAACHTKEGIHSP